MIRSGLPSQLPFNSPSSGRGTGVGISVSNPVYRQLIEGAARHLELTPLTLEGSLADRRALMKLELIVADEDAARQLQSVFRSCDELEEGMRPAVIVALPVAENVEAFDPSHEFDGALPLPQSPSLVRAQLGFLLYSHRTFAKRYQTAIEEIDLNRRIFCSVTSGISVADARLPDMPLTYVNPAFEAMTGYGMEEVVGKNCRFLQGSEHDQPAVALLRNAIRDERESSTIVQNFRKDGTPFWNELFLSPIRNRAGELTHIVGIQTDVTTRVAFETALRESEKLAAVGRLASSIAHEINNPLEAVMNLVYLTERMDISVEAKAMLALADGELRRVKQITTQSLRFYKQSTRAQAAGCTELVDSVLHLYQARFLNGQIQVKRRERSTQSIVCMESEVRQVFSNLVSNAIDAMHGLDDSRLHIRTREATDWRNGRTGVCITVADNGAGMSAEIVKSIYTAFFTTKGDRGTGLGLWISSEIIVRHHGHLRVRSSSRLGRSGTIFALFLPYRGVSP